jgi:iron complex transport system substrate-binding protein
MSAPTPQRIVSLQPSVTQILDALGAAGRIVACTRYCEEVCPGIAEGRAIVADSWSAESAQILAVRPDLVIAAVPYQLEAVAEILKSGARFLGLAPRTLADIYTDIAVLAGIVGLPARGDELVASMQDAIAAVSAQTCSLPRHRVYCEEWGKPLIHSQPWVAELVAAAGGEFLGTPGAHTAATAVAASDPDVIIAAWCGAGDRVPLTKIAADRHWQDLRAVRDGRLYCISDELLNTPGPALIHGLHALAAAIHPEKFAPARGLRSITSAETRELPTP